MDWKHINTQAVAESLRPIRPGIPGEAPFWNSYAKQFIHAPAFEFKKFDEAASYHFEINCWDKMNWREGTTCDFTAAEPWADLGPVWSQIPTGFAALQVTALDKDGNIIGISGLREFYKSAPFSGPPPPPARDFRECAIMALDYFYQLPQVQYWENKAPDPGYSAYRFPAKIIGAVIGAMVAYASLKPDKKERALMLAINAADYLIAAGNPAGHPLQYLPPVYDFKRIGGKNKFFGKLMLSEALLPFNSYISLAKATGRGKYREAAKRIADTYVRLQLPNGSWPLMVNSDSGSPVMDNICLPIRMINMFDVLLNEDGREAYRLARDKAVAWIMEHPVRDFHWESQFEDIMPGSEKYKSMTGFYAAQIALYLLDHGDVHPGRGDIALEIIRYAEDQFVVWDKPMPRPGRHALAASTASWPVPCVLEQYEWDYPIDSSAVNMIRLYIKAYAKTRQDIFLAKALALGSALTAAQDPETGCLSTLLGKMVGDKNIRQRMLWLNCLAFTALGMMELDAFCRQESVQLKEWCHGRA